MTALLSPLQLQAGAALLQNQGIRVNPDLEEQITLYQANPTISPLRDTITVGSANILANTTIATLQTLASNSCPALADSVPQAFINPYPPTNTVSTVFSVTSPSNSDPGLTGMITLITNSYLGNGDVGKFAQVLSAAHGYCVTTNVFINSAVNAENGYLGNTFTDMDNLVTGDLTQVNLDTANFGNDLSKLGESISLADLDNFGSPLALLQRIIKLGGITTPIIVALANTGINENIILELGNPELVVNDVVQKQMYNAMTTIVGDELTQILSILGVTTEGITCLADLINPVKLFPNSYATLTTPVCDGGCEPQSGPVMDIGNVIFQTRTPPSSTDPVYPVSNEAWSPFMNTNAVWEFTGPIFETRQQTDVTPHTDPAWSPFMNTNGVWNSDIFSLKFERTYSVTFPTSGMYSFTVQCDNHATVSLNGNQILYVRGFQGNPQVNEIYVDAGTYTLGIDATNEGSYRGGNPAAFALVIANSVGSGSSSFSRTYTINIPATGTYTITAQADNLGEIIIDGDSANAFAFAGFTGTPLTTDVVLTQGTHEIEVNGTNTEGPAGIGLTIVSGFSTRPTPKCGLRGIYIPDVTGYSSDVSVPKLTEVEYNYRKLFGRKSDSQGYAYWTASGLTGTALFNAMIAAAVPRDLQYYQTRLRLGTFPIYQDPTGPTPTGAVTSSVNSKLVTQLPDNGIGYLRLSKIIPEDIALADRALAVSLQQITNINKITLPQLARAYQNIETNRDLPAINSQFQPVSQDSIDYFKNGMAIGTGDNGTILLTDVIGSASGTVVVDAMGNVITSIDNLAGSLTDLTEIYEVMLGVVNGDFGDPVTGPVIIPSGPGAGTYADADEAILALVVIAQAEITTIQSANLADTASLNEAYSAIGTQLALEYNLQKLATIDVNQLSGNSQASIQTLIFALPAYGKDTDAGGVAQYLEDIADIAHPGGQAIVATLREGRNRTVLNESGLNGSVNISSDPSTPPPQATLIPSEYSQSEALARIVT